jgi:eukaryotic-like serine/threonine-protein kinase
MMTLKKESPLSRSQRESRKNRITVNSTQDSKKTIGKYSIEKFIGSGGMGTVVAARHSYKKDSPIVAIKVLNPRISEEEQFRERFRQEASIQATLNHPNLIQLVEYLENDKKCCLVMEYFKSISLSQMIKKTGPIPYQKAIPIFLQILKGLEYLHQKNLVHRDIKPSNILVGKRDHVKIIDFGIAKSLEQGNEGFITKTGYLVGTYAYISPEQIRGYKANPVSDIYSAGMTFYEALTGKYPFRYSSEFELMELQLKQRPPLPTRYYPYIPNDLVQFVMKSIEKNPSDRFLNCKEMIYELEKIQASDYEAELSIHNENQESDTSKEIEYNTTEESSFSISGLLFILFIIWILYNLFS